MEFTLTAEAVAGLAAAFKAIAKASGNFGDIHMSQTVKISVSENLRVIAAEMTDGYRAVRIPLAPGRAPEGFPNVAAVVEGATKTATWYMEADRAALVAALKAAALMDKNSAAVVFDPASGSYTSLTIAGLGVAATSAAGKEDHRREWRVNPVYMLDALALFAPRKGEADRPVRVWADPVYPELAPNQAASMSALRITAAPDTERMTDPLHTLIMPIRF